MKLNGRPLTIGIIAKLSSVGVETIRYYEREGIIQQPARNGGFREYSEDTVRRIRFIKRTQELGFSLKEISDLLMLQSKGRGTCSTVVAKADRKLSQIAEKISDLKKIQAALLKVKSSCQKNQGGEACPVLENFYA
jgi:Hg(II)-responsive transcriptional regulator